MKNELIRCALICLGLWGCLQAVAQVPGYIPTSGLVACYPFDGNAIDVSGNGNDGIPMGVTPALDRFFRPARAFSFPVSTSAIDCGNDSSLHINDCTISAWVRLSTTTLPRQNLVAKADSAIGGAFAVAVIEDRFRTFFFYDSVAAQLDCYNTLQQANWYLLTVTHSVAFGVNMYINGFMCASTAYTGNLSSGAIDHRLRIGAGGPTIQNPPFGARLDDVAIWNRALGTEDIEAMYASGIVAREEEHLTEPFSLAPNPALGQVHLVVNAELLGERYLIVNALGQEISSGLINDRNTLVTIEGLNAGMYFVQVGMSLPCKKLLIL